MQETQRRLQWPAIGQGHTEEVASQGKAQLARASGSIPTGRGGDSPRRQDVLPGPRARAPTKAAAEEVETPAPATAGEAARVGVRSQVRPGPLSQALLARDGSKQEPSPFLLDRSQHRPSRRLWQGTAGASSGSQSGKTLEGPGAQPSSDSAAGLGRGPALSPSPHPHPHSMYEVLAGTLHRADPRARGSRVAWGGEGAEGVILLQSRGSLGSLGVGRLQRDCPAPQNQSTGSGWGSRPPTPGPQTSRPLRSLWGCSADHPWAP